MWNADAAPQASAEKNENKKKWRAAPSSVSTLLVYVRKGGKLKYELDGLRWKSSYSDDGTGEGPPTGG